MLSIIIFISTFLFLSSCGRPNPSVEISTNKINDTVSVNQFGAKGDGITDDSKAFQMAMNTRKVVVVPATSKFYYIGKTVRVYNSVLGKNNPVLQSSNEAMINNPKNAKDWGKFMIFHVGNKLDDKTLTISNLTFKGPYKNGKLLTEHNHLLSIASSNHVKIKSNTFINAPGDAISVNYFNYHFEKFRQSFSSDIEISDNKIVNPYRCGIALISAQNITISNNNISKTHNYVNAIDLEPEKRGDVMMFAKNININKNVITATTVDIAVNIVGAQDKTTSKVTVSGNQIAAKKTALRIASTYGVVTEVVISNNRFTAPQFLLFKSGNRFFEDITVTNNRQVGDLAFFGNFSKINRLKILNNITKNTSNNLIVFQCNNVEISGNNLVSTNSTPVMLTSNSSISNYVITKNTVSTPLSFISLGYKGTPDFNTQNIKVSENNINSKDKNIIRSYIRVNNIEQIKNNIN